MSESPLVRAANREKAGGENGYAITRYLIEMGADIHATDAHGNTALIIVSGDDSIDLPGKHNQLELVKLLVAKGADPNVRSNHGTTALLAAACNGNSSIVEFLLSVVADPNIGNIDGLTPLICASRPFGKIEVVRLLVKSGANIDVKDKSGMTAADYAKKSNKTEIVDLLRQGRRR